MHARIVTHVTFATLLGSPSCHNSLWTARVSPHPFCPRAKPSQTKDLHTHEACAVLRMNCGILVLRLIPRLCCAVPLL